MCEGSLSGKRKYLDPLKLPDPFNVYSDSPKAEGDVEPPAPPPRLDDPAIMAMRNRERRRLQSQSGRRSTILTGGQGAEMNPVQQRTLLG